MTRRDWDRLLDGEVHDLEVSNVASLRAGAHGSATKRGLKVWVRVSGSHAQLCAYRPGEPSNAPAACRAVEPKKPKRDRDPMGVAPEDGMVGGYDITEIFCQQCLAGYHEACVIQPHSFAGWSLCPCDDAPEHSYFVDGQRRGVSEIDCDTLLRLLGFDPDEIYRLADGEESYA